MVVNKCFKYIIRTFIWGIFILYIGLSVIINLPFVQKKMANMVSSTLEQILTTEVSVGHISLDIFRRIIVEDVLLRDKQGNEMIAVSRLSARYEPLSLLEDKITINSIQLLGFSVQLNKETPNSETNTYQRNMPRIFALFKKIPLYPRLGSEFDRYGQKAPLSRSRCNSRFLIINRTNRRKILTAKYIDNPDSLSKPSGLSYALNQY